MDTKHSGADVLETISLGAGVGLVAIIAFPFALPLVILTLPILVPGIVLGALAALALGAWLVMRAAGRGVRRLWSRTSDVGDLEQGSAIRRPGIEHAPAIEP